MKKIVGIIAALALVSAVFADEPSVTPVTSEFTGNAKLEWIADLDGETTGMANATEASFKLKFVTEGTKSTEGDGLWGELTIKAGNWEIAYGGGEDVVTGINYTEFKDKDDNVMTVELEKDGYTVKKATYKDKNGKEITADKFDLNTAKQTLATKKVLGVPGGASVETAKIHFVEGDFGVALNILKPGFEFGGGKPTLATKSNRDDDKGPVTFAKSSVELKDANGFTVEVTAPIISANLAFADNGQKKSADKKFAFKFDATLKPIDDMSIFAGFAFSTEESKFAAAAKVDYKLALDDTFYLQPAILFTMKQDTATNLGAAVLFGWGAANEGAGFVKFFDDAESVPDNCSNGASVWVDADLKNNKIGLLAGIYDSALIGGALPGFKVGFQLAADNVSDFSNTMVIDAALKYGTTFADIVDFSADFGMEFKKNVALVYGVEVGSKELIENTNVYVNYKGQADSNSLHGGNKKGKVTVGAKISF